MKEVKGETDRNNERNKFNKPLIANLRKKPLSNCITIINRNKMKHIRTVFTCEKMKEGYIIWNEFVAYNMITLKKCHQLKNTKSEEAERIKKKQLLKIKQLTLNGIQLICEQIFIINKKKN